MLALFADTPILVVSALVHKSVTQNPRSRSITYELSTVTSTSATVKHYLKLVRSFHFAKVGAVDSISLAYAEIGQEQLRSLLEDLADSWIMMVVEKIGIELQLVKLHNHIICHGQGYLFGEPRESKH